LFSEYTEYIIGGCLSNKKIDLVLDNRGLNAFDNIRKDINLFVIIFLEYPESAIFFLEFVFLLVLRLE
jgi:hypothetical protein